MTTVWPDVPRTMFGPGPEGQLNACVDWLGQRDDGGLDAYTRGYRRAAEVLLSHARRSGESPEVLLWPMAFLWRHHLELSLKQIVLVGCEIAEAARPNLASHDVEKLWRLALPHIRQVGDEPTLFANVEDGIRRIGALDPSAFGFRYPHAQDFESPSLKSPNRYINLATLDEAMRAIASFLAAAFMELTTRLEYLREARLEAQTGG